VARTVEIAVALKKLEFPPMCANCANATSESLDVARVFHRYDPDSDSGPDSYVVEHVLVPFCPPCMMQHDHEVRKVTPSERFWITWRGKEAMGIAGYGVMTGLLLFMFSLRPNVLIFGLAALFGLGVWYSYRVSYRDSERFAVPPATSIDSAFDFTDVHRRVAKREHRTLMLRNNIFADALVARNPGNLWTDEDEAKSRSDWRRFFR
jgi:hypothetical protein